MVSIKINWNDAMDIHTMKMDIGVVIRDSRDEELATLSESKDYIIVLYVAEVTTAAKFSSELNFFRVILECDVLKIVQALKKKN